jgi:hypothetical protein
MVGSVADIKEPEGGKPSGHLKSREYAAPVERIFPMQIVHPFSGSIQQYNEEISDPDRYRPQSCPQCQAQHPLTAHGFYTRTLSLLPDFALPYLRFGVSLIGLFLVARLLKGRTLEDSATAAGQPRMPYQRGQFWVRRFQKQAESLCAALTAWTAVKQAPNFLVRALRMLESLGWIRAHHRLFSHLRMHLLGWPSFLAPDGRRLSSSGASPNPEA